LPPITGVAIVTGTDTGVGKTITTAAIAAAAMRAGMEVAVIKPAQTGDDSDESVVRALAAPTMVTTLVSYPDPLAPMAAARVADMEPLEMQTVIDAVSRAAEDHDLVLVEGAGGLLVPMGPKWTVADLAQVTGAPAIVVARAALGTLNHTALTMEALRHRDIQPYLIVGAWPSEPETVHFANLGDFGLPLHGLLPDRAGAMEPGVFRRSAPGWLTPTLYGSCDDPRELAGE
jgi:dethiobiotin synthetase